MKLSGPRRIAVGALPENYTVPLTARDTNEPAELLRIVCAVALVDVRLEFSIGHGLAPVLEPQDIKDAPAVPISAAFRTLAMVIQQLVFRGG
jgi:hypothetical protein